MKQNINTTDLYHDLKAMDRDNFSYNGAKALMEYLEELEDDIGESIEYDPIAFCCDYAEYGEDEYQDLAQEYNQDFGNADEFDTDEFFSWLQDNTTMIEFGGGIIVQSF